MLLGGGYSFIAYTDPPTLSNLVLNLLLLQSGYVGVSASYNGVTWFLAPLFLCYILFYWNSRQKNAVYMILTYSLLTIAIVSILSGMDYPFFNLKMMRGILGFFSGVLFQRCYEWVCNKEIKWAGYLSLGILGYISIIMGYHYTGNLFIVVDLLIMPCVVFIFQYIPILKSLFNHATFHALGTVSYFCFIWHMFIEASLAFVTEYFKLHVRYDGILFMSVYAIILIVFIYLSKKLMDQIYKLYQ